MTDGCSDVAHLHSAWIDGALPPDEHARVGAHLDACSHCQEEVAGLERVRVLVRNLPVRRLPDGVELRPAPAGWQPPGQQARTPAVPSGSQRLAAGLAVAVGLLSGAAFALGDEPQRDGRVVDVPVDSFVADHLVQTVGGPLSTPVVVDSRR